MSQPQPKALRNARYVQYGLLFCFIIFGIFATVFLSQENYGKQLNGLAIDSQDNFYVSDAGNSTIRKYDTQGKLLATWGSEGSGDGQFALYNLGKIAIGPQDELYALDEGNYRVQKFDSSGKFLAKWGSKGIEPGQFGSFYYKDSFIVDGQGQVYIQTNKAIQKYDANGNFLGNLGDGLPDKPRLSDRNNLAVDEAGNVYIYSTVQGPIYRFDSKGQPLTSLPIQGIDLDHFNNFGNMALDRQGNIYLTDLNNDLMIKLDPAGKYLTRWDVSGKELGSSPYRVTASDSHNNIYMLNEAADRVEVFDNNGRSLNQFSIGWPKWLLDYRYAFMLVLPLMYLALTIFEMRYRRIHNLPEVIASKKREPLLAPSLAGKISQLVNFFAGCVGFLLCLSSAAGSSNVNSSRFISFNSVQSTILVSWVVVATFIVVWAMVSIVPKRPIMAGFVQIAGAGLIYFASLEQNLKMVAIIIAIGGILAILSSFQKNYEVPLDRNISKG